jgi:hypothetical protein
MESVEGLLRGLKLTDQEREAVKIGWRGGGRLVLWS